MTGNNSYYIIKYGFKSGVALTYLYATIFILYAIIRSSRTIINQLAPEEGLYSTLFANATCMLISTLSITTLISFGAGVLGMFTVLIIRWFLDKPGKKYVHFLPWFTGLFTSLLLSLMLQLFLFTVTGFSWVRSSPEAYWFWIGLPTLIYLVTACVLANKFDKLFIQ